MSTAEPLFFFLNESEFNPNFLRDVKWQKRKLFDQEFCAEDIDNKSILELAIISEADPEWIRKKIIEQPIKDNYSASFSSSLYLLTVLSYELIEYQAREFANSNIKDRLNNLLACLSTNRTLYRPKEKGFFEAMATCPAENEDLKRLLSLHFMRLHCATVNYNGRYSDSYFPAMVSQFLIAQKAEIENPTLILQDGIGKEFVDQNFLFKNIDDLEGYIKKWISSLRMEQKQSAAMFFFFEYLPILGQLSLIDGVSFHAISQGVKNCCQAFANVTNMRESEVKLHFEAISKRIALISSDLSAKLKVSPLDLVDPAFSCTFNGKDYPSQFQSLARIENHDCNLLLGEALGKHIKKLSGMPDLMVKTGILNTHFNDNDLLLVMLNYCNSKAMVDSFLFSNTRVTTKEYKTVKSSIRAGIDKYFEESLQLKVAESILNSTDFKRAKKLPFAINDKSKFIKHLTRNNKFLDEAAVSLLNLTVQDLHLIDQNQHAKFKRLILSQDLEL